MKKKVTYFQSNLIAGMMLLCNIAALPNQFNPILYNSLESEAIQNGDEIDNPKTDPDEDEEETPEIPEEPEKEWFDFDTDLIIEVVSPGYTINGQSDVGEFIVLQNLADAELELAGYTLVYYNSNGTPSTLFTFPEGSYMAGKHLLLRFNGDRTFDRAQADIIYKGSGMAMKAGTLQLMRDDEALDEVCWNKGATNNCYEQFQNTNKTETVIRTVLTRDLETGDFMHLPFDEYELEYNEIDFGYEVLPEEEEPGEELAPQCRGLEFSEILTYYVDDKAEQFIELYNPTSREIILDGCVINYKKKNYELNGQIGAGKYYAFYQGDLFAMTKNPTNPLTLTLIDVDGEVVDEMAYGTGQKKSTSYARTYDENGVDSWQVTYAITPNAENIYQKYRNCEEGKVINETTGNCVKTTATKTSSNTSSSSASKTLAPCPEGQYRNPLTNRCKKITTTSSTLKECAEGYERNPETNRCRKITTPNEGTEYALVPNTYADKKVFVGIGIVVVIILLGLTYVGLQFWHEIARTARIVRQRGSDLLVRLRSGKK